MSNTNPLQQEVSVIKGCCGWLERLDRSGQTRVLDWLNGFFRETGNGDDTDNHRFGIYEFLDDGTRREIYPGLTWSGEAADENLRRLQRQYPKQHMELVLKETVFISRGLRGEGNNQEELSNVDTSAN